MTIAIHWYHNHRYWVLNNDFHRGGGNHPLLRVCCYKNGSGRRGLRGCQVFYFDDQLLLLSLKILNKSAYKYTFLKRKFYKESDGDINMTQNSLHFEK